MVEVSQGNACERLYLEKQGSHVLFVNNCQLLKQHQINGLRFLYIQFKKKKQGVILNFPTHTGKSVTVVLFVHAIISVLKKPILVLCKNDNELYVWKEHFLQWTDLSEDDIEVESRKVVKGKKVFIKKVDDLTYYQNHSWSIVVAKHDLIDKDMCQINDAEYKIWVTSTDMKKDLKMLAFIYNWLYPKQKMDIKDFIPSEKTSREILLKSIYLDTFLEDFVVREDNVKQFDGIKKSKATDSRSNEYNDTRIKKSRKNKDATGTKIKRTRRIIDDDEMIANEMEATTNIPVINESIVNKHDVEILNEVDNLTNINNDKSTICEPTDSLMKRNLSHDVVETDMEVDSEEPMNFRDAINEIVKNENIMQTENSTESIHSEEIGNEANDNLENKESLNIDDNDMKQDILDHSNDIIRNEPSVDVKEEYKEVVKDQDQSNQVSDLDKSNEVKAKNNIDAKLSELEEKTMKKFKGSFLDSIF